jgi:hypothetical protein
MSNVSRKRSDILGKKGKEKGWKKAVSRVICIIAGLV